MEKGNGKRSIWITVENPLTFGEHYRRQKMKKDRDPFIDDYVDEWKEKVFDGLTDIITVIAVILTALVVFITAKIIGG